MLTKCKWGSVHRNNNGSDNNDNLITLCKDCHDKVHSNEIKLSKGKKKSQLKHATQMNSIRMQLLKMLPEVEETFGFITKEHRQLLNLPKEHYCDAIAIASEGNEVAMKTTILYKKCVADGDYQQTKGIRSEQKIPTNKIQGFRKFDKIRYLGKEYFIKGRMSSGYAILMDINNNTIKFTKKGMRTPKLSNMKKIGARKTCIM